MIDDLIVGGGTAGCVLAARLSEDSARQVTLLEAGPDYPTLDAIPADLLTRQLPIAYDWGFVSEPTTGREAPLARGRVIGGSSSVNGAVALRGLPADYDEWEALGNPGWGWNDVLPFFKKLEDDLDEIGPLHGQGGPIPIHRRTRDELSPIHRAFIDACAGFGFPLVRDHNDPAATGVGPIPLNFHDRRRVSTAIGYLVPARSRPNLTVCGDCLVDSLLFDGDRAIGVRTVGGERILARRVILAAGTIGSPAILLRSGVGPRDDLARLGIPLIADLPVGVGLNDHPTCALALIARPLEWDRTWPIVQAVLRHTAEGSAEFNDMQLFPGSYLEREVEGVFGGYVGLSTVVHRSHSRGRLSLRTTNPHDAPRIQLNLLDDPEDLRRAVAEIRLGWRVVHSPPMTDYVDGVAGLDQATLDDDDRLAAWALGHATTTHHQVSTARMGPASDPRTVVDHRGRVHGLENLVVADSAIAPVVPRANTNLTAIMIGERMAATLGNE